MILVQNRLRLLSGNNLILIFCMSMIMASCGMFSSKNGQNSGNSTSQGNNDVVEVDTIEWNKVPEEDFPPISNADVDLDSKQGEKSKEKKESYNITAFLPFETSRIQYNAEYPQDIRKLKYLQYYAGMKLALEQLEKEDININIDVFDSKESLTTVKQVLNNKVTNETDVILGSLKK